MARRRTELYRREKPEKRRGKNWRQLPLSTCVEAFIGISLVMATLATLLWALGIMDFTAERGYLRFSPLGIEPTRSKATFCGFAFLFLPDQLESTRLCIAFNLFPFTVLPLIVLFMTILRVIGGLTSNRD